MKPQTNLIVPLEYQLPKDQAKKNFLFLYNKGYAGFPIEMLARLWAGAILPSIVNLPGFGKDKKKLRAFAQKFQTSGAAGYLKIKKTSDTFEVALPVCKLNGKEPDSLAYVLKSSFLDDKDESSYAPVTDADLIKEFVFTGEDVLAHAPPIMRTNLGSCVRSVTIEYAGTKGMIFLNLSILKAEAESLTSSPWLEIRAIDLHPLLLQWVANGYGQLEKAAPSAFSISRIARTLPPTGTPRVDEFGLTIAPDGTPYYVPAVLDNTKRYEDLYTQAGLSDDGSYSLLDVSDLDAITDDGKETKVGLPKNVPVLVDWVNNKNSFTNTSGVLQVQDLSRFQKCNMSHVKSLLENLVLDDKTFSRLANIAYTSGLGTNALINSQEAEAINANSSGMNMNVSVGISTEEYFDALLKAHTATTDQLAIPLRYFVPDSPEYSPIFRFFKAAYQAVLENIEAVNTKYSVSYCSANFALIILVAQYCSKFPEVVANSNKINAAALNQNADPNWEVPSIPLAGDFGFLPHQAKVRNLMKDSPDFAILPVQAGGGKSILAISDVLLEIKANRSQPYLIMCPPHLVAQYVKEITYFTKGKLNVIPVNSYVVKRSGLNRLGDMLEKAPRNTVVVCDYDVLRYRSYNVCYGTSNVVVYPIIEFLRNFKFGYAFMDESHYLKNDSGRSRATLAMIATIPKKRLASGTMAHDSPSDLALQISILDPTLFGSREDFNERYGAEISGSRVMKWKEGAQKAIMDTIRSKVVVAGAMRKEWAALLPVSEEKIITVDLTPAQKAAYRSILEKVIIKAKEDAKASNNTKLLDFLDNKTPANEEEDGGALDEFSDEALIAMLQPYLARLEQFVTAPASDEYGDAVLKGDDRISPKVLKCYDRIREHISGNMPGKVLIFTSYTASAEAIYDNMPPDLKAQALLYLAAEKTEAGSKFEKDPNCKIMVGVEASMNTGLNLQYCFPAHTPVLIDHERSLTIEEVCENDDVTHVLSYDLDSKKIEKRKILRKIRTLVTDDDSYVNVIVRDNLTGETSSVTCTNNHPFIVKGGAEVAAGDLEVGTQLYTYGAKYTRHKVNAEQDIVPFSETSNVVCEDCGLSMYPSALLKHSAVAHKKNVALYREAKARKSKATREQTEATKIKRAKSLSNFYQSDEGKEVHAKILEARWKDPKAKVSQSKLMKKRWADPEQRAIISAHIAEAYANLSIADRELQSARSKALWESSDYRAKIAEAVSRYKASPKYQKHLKSNALATKRMWADPEKRARIVRSMAGTNATIERTQHRRNEMISRHLDSAYTERTVGAMLAAQEVLPNKPERNIIALNVSNLEYTGAGDYFVTLTRPDGSRWVKNPDFISLNHLTKKGRTRRVVEVIGARDYTGRDAEYDKMLIEAYADIGIECLIIDAEDCYSDVENVRDRLHSFINNHFLTVVKVQRNTNNNTIGKYKYDLEIQKNHNFFVTTTYNQGGHQGYVPKIPVLVHNCSRLIRMESCWNPGTLEQGNARINRPELKKSENRAKIYFDWLVANSTIDITKISRLISKIIAVGKFENTDTAFYDNVPDVPVIKMNLDSVLAYNDFSDTLKPYAEAYRDYNQAKFNDYADYKAKYEAIYGELKLKPIIKAQDPTDAKIIKDVPYTPGLEIPGMADLGLVRLDEYLNQAPDESGDDSDDDVGAEDLSRKELVAQMMTKLNGKLVHTEYGDGYIKSIRPFSGGRGATVDLGEGNTVIVKIASIFVITKDVIGSKDIRDAVLKTTGLPITNSCTVPGLNQKFNPAVMKRLEKQKEIEERKRKKDLDDKKKEMIVELHFTVSNGYLGIAYFTDEKNPEVDNVLQGFGFRPTPQFYHAEVKTGKALLKQFNMWSEKGFTFDKNIRNLGISGGFQSMLKLLNSGAVKTDRLSYQFGTKTKMFNFYKAEAKPSIDAQGLKAYPMIEDGHAFIMLPYRGQAATREAIKIKAPTIRWTLSEPSLTLPCTDMNVAINAIKSIVDSGVQISNIEDLRKRAAKLKKAKFIEDEGSPLQL